MQRITIIVHGQVQGVGYRYTTHLEAAKLGLTAMSTTVPMAPSKLWPKVKLRPCKPCWIGPRLVPPPHR
jgi:hypothetical protein